MKNSIIKQIGSGGQGMTPKQKEDLAGLLSRMAEVEAIFQGMDAADYEALKDTAEVKQAVDMLNIVCKNLSNAYSKINLTCNVNVTAGGAVTVGRNYSELVEASNQGSHIIFNVNDLKHEIVFTAEAESFSINNNNRVFVAHTTYRSSAFGATEPTDKDKHIFLFVWGYNNQGQTETKGAIHIVDKEDVSNKVTSLSAQSTNTQYPSAKCVYDAIQAEIGAINTILDTI